MENNYSEREHEAVIKGAERYGIKFIDLKSDFGFKYVFGTQGRESELLRLIKAEAPCQIEARSTRLSGSAIDMDHPLVRRGRDIGLPSVGSPTLSNQALCSFPSVKLGPGDSFRSHTADEYVNVEDIGKAVDIYVNLLNGLVL